MTKFGVAMEDFLQAREDLLEYQAKAGSWWDKYEHGKQLQDAYNIMLERLEEAVTDTRPSDMSVLED